MRVAYGLSFSFTYIKNVVFRTIQHHQTINILYSKKFRFQKTTFSPLADLTIFRNKRKQNSFLDFQTDSLVANTVQTNEQADQQKAYLWLCIKQTEEGQTGGEDLVHDERQQNRYTKRRKHYKPFERLHRNADSFLFHSIVHFLTLLGGN